MIYVTEYRVPTVITMNRYRHEAWYKLQMRLEAADRQMAEGMMLDHSDVMTRLKVRIEKLREAPT